MDILDIALVNLRENSVQDLYSGFLYQKLYTLFVTAAEKETIKVLAFETNVSVNESKICFKNITMECGFGVVGEVKQKWVKL